MENFDYDKIHDYFGGQLNAAENANFEQETTTDEALNQEVEFYKELMQGIDLFGDQELQSTIQKTHTQAAEKALLLTDQDIFDYLNDDLSEKKIDLVEQRMASDTAFLNDIEFHQNLITGIRLSGDEDLKQQIKGTHEKMKAKGALGEKKTAKVVSMKTTTAQSRGRFFSSRNLALAASFLLLLSVGLYFLVPSNGNNNQIYASHFEINETQLEEDLDQLNLVGFGASDKEQKENLIPALELFQATSYDAAINALNSHLNQYPNDEKALFYKGLALMKTKTFQDAISSFEQLNVSESYRSGAIWYQALSYLKLEKDSETALNLLQSISDDPAYGRSAQAAIEQLKEE